MLKIGNNTHNARQQVQNNNTKLHFENDGETVQLIATQVRTDTFKTHLDRWHRNVPDTPRIGNYGASVGAETGVKFG